MSTGWIDQACTLLQSETALVRITVARTRGSSPREPGATMLVTASEQWNTIGGGHLEWQAVENARRLLRDGHAPAVQVEHLLLGPDLAQCCGGEVTLWMERIPSQARAELQSLRGQGALHSRFDAGRMHRQALSDVQDARSCWLGVHGGAPELVEALPTARQPLWIFGAGHVGQAVMRLLQALPLFDVRWVDNRPGIAHADPLLAAQLQCEAEPCDLVAHAPAGTWWLVFTHDHELDFQLCHAILARQGPEWLGLIGSASKAARFRSRLRKAGHGAESLARMDCPVGLTAIRSKLPAAIAVGITARLLERVTYQAAPALLPVASPVLACDPACGRCVERRPA